MSSDADRRRCERYVEHLVVTYSLLVDRHTTPVLFTDTKTLEISRSGVRLSTQEDVPVNTIVQMSIRVPSIRSPVLMLGKVKWCREVERGEYQMGIQFMGYLPQGLEDIIARISHHRQRVESERSGQ